MAFLCLITSLLIFIFALGYCRPRKKYFGGDGPFRQAMRKTKKGQDDKK